MQWLKNVIFFLGYKCVNVLLENAKKLKIDVNAQGLFGQTALHFLVHDTSWEESGTYLKLMLDNAEKYGNLFGFIC